MSTKFFEKKASSAFQITLPSGVEACRTKTQVLFTFSQSFHMGVYFQHGQSVLTEEKLVSIVFKLN